MIPTKFSNLTNQEVIDKLAKIVAKRKDNSEVVLMEPIDASDILLEARNRIESLVLIKNLFERPACAQMSLDLTADFKLELNLKVKN